MKKFLFSTAFLAIIACLLWSSAFVGIKIGLPYTTPIQFAGIRFFISGLMILPFAGSLKSFSGIIKANLKIILLISFVNTFIQYSLFYMGINLVPASLTAIIVGSGPIFVAMVAHFFMSDDRMSFNKLLIFLFGFSGIVLVSLGRNRFTTSGEIPVLGILLLVFTNINSGFGNVLVARDAKNVPPLVLSSLSMIIGGAGLFLLSLPIEGFHLSGPKPIEFYASLGWLSFLSAAAISIWFVLLKRPGVKISNLNFWKFLIPVTGAVLAWILMPDEKPNLIAYAGMAIIAFSLVMLNIYKKRNG